MAFAIMRAKKLKGMGSAAASLKHCYRERETPNADPERTPDNLDLVETTSTDQAMGKLQARLPEKRRKDAVLAVEYMMGASPDWWQQAPKEQKSEFFSCSLKWLQDKYGTDNVIAATIHNDELSPHLSAYVVPKTTDGRLSAKDFIGNRSKMSQDQTTYARCVQHLGLERGIQGSRATHQRVKAHYEAVNGVEKQVPHITPGELKQQKVTGSTLAQKVLGARENDFGVTVRLNTKIKNSVKQIAHKASESDRERCRRKELEQTVIAQRHRLKEMQEPFQGLTRDQVTEVLRLATSMQSENRQKRENKKVRSQSR